MIRTRREVVHEVYATRLLVQHQAGRRTRVVHVDGVDADSAHFRLDVEAADDHEDASVVGHRDGRVAVHVVVVRERRGRLKASAQSARQPLVTLFRHVVYNEELTCPYNVPSEYFVSVGAVSSPQGFGVEPWEATT